MNDIANLYAKTLQTLGDILTAMTSPDWDAMMQTKTAEDRMNAMLTMLKVQQARLTLGNAALGEIVTELQENEAALKKGIAQLKKSLDALDNVEKILKGVTAVLGVVAKIVTLV